MPQLVLFAVGQAVILNKDDNLLSVINCFSGMTFQPADDSEPEPVSGNVVAPLKWGAGSIWKRLPEDEGKQFEQKVEIIRPDGVAVGGATGQFEMSAHRHNLTVGGDVFPVAGPGEYIVRLSLRENREGAEWEQKADYPIEVLASG